MRALAFILMGLFGWVTTASAVEINRRHLLILGGAAVAVPIIKPASALPGESTLSPAETIKLLLEAAAKAHPSFAVRMGQIAHLQGFLLADMQFLETLKDRASLPSREDLVRRAVSPSIEPQPSTLSWERAYALTSDGRLVSGVARRFLVSRFARVQEMVLSVAKFGRAVQPQDIDQLAVETSPECDPLLLPDNQEGLIMIAHDPKKE